MRKSMFLDPTKDFVFKTLWYRGNSDVRKYLERMVEYAIGHKIGKYTLGPNEQGILSYSDIATKVDILLVSEDKTYKINVEMNRLDKVGTSKEKIKSADNKSDIYLSNFVANFYNDLEGKEYKETIKVEQVNFNAYYCPENKLISKLDFEFIDLNYMIVKNGIKSHLLYLPRLRDLCYNQVDDIYKDFALLLCNSYEEMELLAKGNKEREETVKFIKELGVDEMFISEEKKREYERIQAEISKEEAVKEAKEKSLEQGIEQGIEQGRKETLADMIKAMYQNGISINLIAKSAKISTEEVKKILNIV